MDRLVDAGCEDEGPPEALRFRAFREKDTTSEELGAYLTRSVKIQHADCQVVACREGVTSPKCGEAGIYTQLGQVTSLPPCHSSPSQPGAAALSIRRAECARPIPVAHKHQAARQCYQQYQPQLWKGMENLACFVDRFLAGLTLEGTNNGQRSNSPRFRWSARFPSVRALEATCWLEKPTT